MRFLFCLPFLLATTPHAAFSQGSKADYERAMGLEKRVSNKVFRDTVEPVWLPDGKQFWYRVETGPGRHELVLVDAVRGLQQVITDLSLLPQGPALKSSELPLRIDRTRRTGPACRLTILNSTPQAVEMFWIDPDGKHQSYGKVEPGAEAGQSTYAGHHWVVKDLSGKPMASVAATPGSMRLEVDGPPESTNEADEPDHSTDRKSSSRGQISPDGKQRIIARDQNLFLKTGDSAEIALTKDGTAGNGYQSEVVWAPDSAAFVTTQVVPGQQHKVHLVESAPAGQLQPKLFTHNYLKPGDRLPKPRPVLIEIPTHRVVKIADELFPNFFNTGEPLDYRWQPDSKSFTFSYNQRGHQVFRILSVDRGTATARTLVDETSNTFIDYTQKTWHQFLDETKELLWMSERDAWCHLYLIDATNGHVKNQITSGPWVVRRVDSVDEKARQIGFYASGQKAGQDPYQQHLYRIGFDGTKMLCLTEGDGNHSVVFSPDRQWMIDTWSRPDQPPVTELRRADDGKLILNLERSDASALLAGGWQVPERFSAKGRDGQTDIYGLIYKPTNFDPAKSYPVIENIYAGPHDSFVSKEFSIRAGAKGPLAELGFIVMQIDGMGTNNRGKKFHDVAWKNLADAGFPDRIAWMKAASATRPWMDLSRVGIYGGSAGGQNAMRALIDHADFYKAAAADCGCHDNRMDKIWWNEQWMGWPVDYSYERSSNVVHANRMQGHLLLTVGEMDKNVDPASTMQLADALIKADKDFELLIVPGGGHGSGETKYAARRRMDFFVRHLMGHQPR